MVDKDGGEASTLAIHGIARVVDSIGPQIEHANIVNLDWALAHMDVVKSKKTQQRRSTAEDWVYEAEINETTGGDVSAILHFSECDAYAVKRRRILRVSEPYFWMTVRVVSTSRVLTEVPIRVCTSGVPEIMEDSISKILERRGIKYSHRNDEILVPSTIEEHRMKKARKVRAMMFVWIRRASNSHRL